MLNRVRGKMAGGSIYRHLTAVVRGNREIWEDWTFGIKVCPYSKSSGKQPSVKLRYRQTYNLPLRQYAILHLAIHDVKVKNESILHI